MKILIVTTFFPTGKDLRFSGGVEARSYFLGKYLTKRHKVFVICSRQPGTKKSEVVGGMNVIRVGMPFPYNTGSGKINPLKLLIFILSAIKMGVKINPDVVDGGNFFSHLIAKQIGLACKAPVIFWYPDVFIGRWIKTSGIISGFTGWTCEKLNLHRGADRFIAISPQTRLRLTKNGVSKKLVVVVPCGIEPKEFKFTLKKFKIPTIITISRLVGYKRIEDLIWAFANMLKNGIAVNLLVIGQGPETKKLKLIVKMLKLNKYVEFRSNLSRIELVRSIKSSYIFCLPSEIEGFGIAVIEAAAASVPYVVSNIPVFKEVTNNGKGGLIFEVGNIRDLSNKLERLLVDRVLYEQKSKEGKKLVQKYDWQDIAKQTENVYRQLL